VIDLTAHIKEAKERLATEAMTLTERANAFQSRVTPLQ
jgi:hypothetical protein